MSDGPDQPALTSGRDIVGLFGFLGSVFALSAIGGAVTVTTVGGWYQTLAKPWFTPPDWVFGPTWSVLYILVAISGWRVWRLTGWRAGRTALSIYVVQLALNLAWPILFFGLRWIDLAAIESGILFAAIVLNCVVFWRIEAMAGWLLVPYAVWVAFATVLNFAFWALN